MAFAGVVGTVILIFFLLVSDGNQAFLFNYLRTSSMYLGLHLAIAVTAKFVWLTYLK
jgi:hypothetical protein